MELLDADLDMTVQLLQTRFSGSVVRFATVGTLRWQNTIRFKYEVRLIESSESLPLPKTFLVSNLLG